MHFLDQFTVCVSYIKACLHTDFSSFLLVELPEAVSHLINSWDITLPIHSSCLGAVGFALSECIIKKRSNIIPSLLLSVTLNVSFGLNVSPYMMCMYFNLKGSVFIWHHLTFAWLTSWQYALSFHRFKFLQAHFV